MNENEETKSKLIEALVRQREVDDIINLIQEKYHINDEGSKLETLATATATTIIGEFSSENSDLASNKDDSSSQKSSLDTGFYETNNPEQSSTNTVTSAATSTTSHQSQEPELHEDLLFVSNNKEYKKEIESTISEDLNQQLNEDCCDNVKEDVENVNFDQEDNGENDYNDGCDEENDEEDSNYFVEVEEDSAGSASVNTLEKLNEFFERAIEFGANALDLSRKGLKKVPKKIV